MTVLSIKPRSKGIKPFETKFSQPASSLTVSEVKRQIRAVSKLDANRQRLTTADKKVLDDPDKTLDRYGVKDGDVLLLKDLGPQISWRTVFLTEYAGPILIHPLFYFSNPLSDALYGGPVAHSDMQRIAFSLVILHYLKREVETVFVHRFSNATMPAFNIFKNSGHYWILSGLLLAYPIYGPGSSATGVEGTVFSNPKFFWPLVGLWAYAEMSNALVHLNLRSLRPPGTRTRAIPHGYGFSAPLAVACPNYLFEGLAWLAFTVLTGNLFSALFLAVSVGQMGIWAKKKVRAYKKEFGDKWPRGRKAMIPFLF